MKISHPQEAGGNDSRHCASGVTKKFRHIRNQILHWEIHVSYSLRLSLIVKEIRSQDPAVGYNNNHNNQQGGACRANMAYIVWTSNLGHNLSLENQTQLNHKSFIQETLAHVTKFHGVKLSIEAFAFHSCFMQYLFTPISIIYPQIYFFLPIRDYISL